MNIILDTHIVLWWLNDDNKLSGNHRRIVEDTTNLCFISGATIWEISIKSKIGKLTISEGYTDQLLSEGFQSLPITWDHADHVRDLPLIHNDPFDRLLIAQAQLEGFSLLSVDENIQKYEVHCL